VEHLSDEPAAAGGVLLRFGSSRYVIALAAVAEVVPAPPLTRLPGAPSWLLGVANVRGRVVPVLDLRPILGAVCVPLASSARLVVIRVDGVAAGVVAEAVPGVLESSLADCEPVPPLLSGDASALVRGLVHDRLGPVAVLDEHVVLGLRSRLPRTRRAA
jgi:purine-binding chemotaxis protein CheW